jgi:rRNA maturation endonuclease Nob1
MSQFFECYDCGKVAPLFDGANKEICPLCGSRRGQAISRERFDEAFKAGVFFNIDLKTGKPAKKKRGK